MVYSGEEFGLSQPCRSVGHWNPATQYEVFQVLFGTVIVFVATSDSDSWWHVAHEGQFVEVPRGSWHLTFAPFGPASVLNIYSSGAGVVDSTVHGDSEKYMSRPALPVRLIEEDGRFVWLLCDDPIDCEVRPTEVLREQGEQCWLHDLVKSANTNLLTRFTQEPGRLDVVPEPTVGRVVMDGQVSKICFDDDPRNFGAALGEVTWKRRAVVLADANPGRLHGERVVVSLQNAGFNVDFRSFVTKNHEKSLETAARVYETFAELEVDSSTVVVLLGGNVLIDCAGYASSTYFRGLDYGVIGTTLLAQADGALGGTLGVHFGGMTNHVGCRRQPLLVFNAPEVLATLPLAEVAAGYAEIIKQAVMVDARLFERIETMGGVTAMLHENVVRIASDVALQKVELLNDSTDGCLNYGHTLGQALEGMTGHRLLRHGEAVAIGMVFANELAVGQGLMDAESAERVNAVIRDFGLPLTPPMDALVKRFGGREAVAQRLLHGISRDKKSTGDAVRWVLPNGIGSFVHQLVEPAVVAQHVHRFLEDQHSLQNMELADV